MKPVLPGVKRSYREPLSLDCVPRSAYRSPTRDLELDVAGSLVKEEWRSLGSGRVPPPSGLSEKPEFWPARGPGAWLPPESDRPASELASQS